METTEKGLVSKPQSATDFIRKSLLEIWGCVLGTEVFYLITFRFIGPAIAAVVPIVAWVLYAIANLFRILYLTLESRKHLEPLPEVLKEPAPLKADEDLRLSSTGFQAVWFLVGVPISMGLILSVDRGINFLIAPILGLFAVCLYGLLPLAIFSLLANTAIFTKTSFRTRRIINGTIKSATLFAVDGLCTSIRSV